MEEIPGQAGQNPILTIDTRDHRQSQVPVFNLLVLLVLYPIVFLSGYFISAPFLDSKGVPFWLSLFVGNLFSTQLLGWLAVPVIFPLFGCGTLEAGRRLRVVTDPPRDLYGGLRLASLKSGSYLRIFRCGFDARQKADRFAPVWKSVRSEPAR